MGFFIKFIAWSIVGIALIGAFLVCVADVQSESNVTKTEISVDK